MAEDERTAFQNLASAAIRVARTPMKDVPITSEMARAVFGLTLQLACMGFIGVREAQEAADRVSNDSFELEMGGHKSHF